MASTNYVVCINYQYNGHLQYIIITNTYQIDQYNFMERQNPGWQSQLINSQRSRILRIFVYYCSFGNRENYSLLKIQNYHRLLIDLQVVEDTSKKQKYDVIFFESASGQKHLHFDLFLTKIGKISQLAFPDLDEKEALNRLILIHLQPLYNYIMNETDYGNALGELKLEHFTDQAFKFLKYYQEKLYILYNHVFSAENLLSTNSLEDEFKLLCKLAKQYSLLPKIVTKSENYLVFKFLTEKTAKNIFKQQFAEKRLHPSKDYQFDFFAFMEYLIILSHINSSQESEEETKLCNLLEFIEISKGYQKLAKQVRLDVHFCLTKNRQKEKNEDVKRLFETPIKMNASRYEQPLIKTVESPLKRELGEYFQSLKLKFIKLCRKKIVEEKFYMEHSTAKKLIASLCRHISVHEIDLLLASIGRLSFDNFIKMLKKLSEKQQLDLHNVYSQVIAYNTGQFSISLMFEHLKIEKEEYELCKQALTLTESYLKNMYDFYKLNDYLNLNTYSRFLQDTTLCPRMVSLKEVPDIFEECSGNHMFEKMSLEEFQYSLILIAISSHFDILLEGFEKLIYLLERMCTSKRGESLMRKNKYLIKEDPLYMLKIKFRDHYERIEDKLELKNQLHENQKILKQI